MWAQGGSFAFIDKPSSKFMVMVFGSGVSIIEQYRLSKRVSAAIGAVWTTTRYSGVDGHDSP
jgi:hypothetical protein